MRQPETAGALFCDVEAFAVHKDDIDLHLATFVATFEEPASCSEAAFEWALWELLQRVHDLDARRHPYAKGYDPDPESPTFAMSVAAHPFFVVGLHPAATRVTRRFAHPAVVFNSHVQFERLKRNGAYARIQTEVRAREIALEGSINPNLAEFGARSEARQYSGRPVPADWRCPFVAVTR
jgi:hypothetical protein